LRLPGGGVFEDATKLVVAIRDGCTTELASSGTKCNGLNALCTIAEMVCGGRDTVMMEEMRHQFWNDGTIEESMDCIISEMTGQELRDLCRNEERGSGFLRKMERLWCYGVARGVFEDFGRLIAELKERLREPDHEEYQSDRPSEADNDQSENEEDEEDDYSEHEDESEQEEADERATSEGTFVNSEEELEFMCCFDSGGAPKNDRKSKHILAKYERRRAGHA
jgi:hypothetical protein